MENNEKLVEKSNRIIELLENLVIINGRSAGIKSTELRKILGVGMNRITEITKTIRVEKEVE